VIVALILLRIARRSATLEETDLRTILETEFSHDGQPDLRLSVYEVADEHTEIVRTYAQHTASAPAIDPPFRRRHHFNVSGLELRPSTRAPMASVFTQLRASHREFRFADTGELRGFVGSSGNSTGRRTIGSTETVRPRCRMGNGQGEPARLERLSREANRVSIDGSSRFGCAYCHRRRPGTDPLAAVLVIHLGLQDLPVGRFFFGSQEAF
jgi:hypothetical protein